MAAASTPKGIQPQQAAGQPAVGGADCASNGSAAGPSRSRREQGFQLSDVQQQQHDDVNDTQPPSAGEWAVTWECFAIVKGLQNTLS